VNTNNGILDGFASYTDTQKTAALIPALKKLGLAVDQKGTKVFFAGSAEKLNAVLETLGK
jgi:hypothetical protein